MFSELLSTNDNKQLKLWIKNKDKPLFITGYNGCGKTYLANELLKSYHIININSEHLKYSKDITEYLYSSLFKKDIFMMINPDKQYKALLVDDIQLFIQNDKPTLGKIHKFTQNIAYKQNPVIFVCNETEDKCCKSIKLNSYVIEIKFNYQHYVNILKDKLDISTINSFILKTKNLNTILSTATDFNHVYNDTTDSSTITLNKILTNSYSINETLRHCSSEYTILSLNMLEIVPSLIKNINSTTLYHIYKSVIYDDYIEYKYIQNNIPVDINIFYACVIPLVYIKRSITNKVNVKYNRYISRSIIQIHNQNILQDNTVIYLNILKHIHKCISDICADRRTIIKNDLDKIEIKTLEKQMKVFNFYYNKNMNKNQLTKILKSIS